MAETTPASELSSTEIAAWRGFLRVHSALVRRLDSELEHAHGLPLTCYEVLITLREAEGQRLRMAELADRALLSRSGMTRLVDRLERDGLLKRTPCASDARGCFACLTPAGAELLARARPTHLDGVRRAFLRHLEHGELEHLAEIWARMLNGEENLTTPH